MKKILIKNALIINENRQIPGSILIEGQFISDILLPDSDVPSSADQVIDAQGHYLLPGIIDDQVHFREPGLTHKGDIGSESKAAVAGGITSFMEMPNTKPQTITQKLLEEKYKRASETSAANYSFYMGATNDNIDEILKTNPSDVCGIKVFMGASTGNMLVDDITALTAIFSQSPMLIAVHSEDEPIIQSNIQAAKERFGEDVPVEYHPVIRSEEACYKSTKKAVDLAEKYNTRLHILHLSTARELEFFRSDIPLTEKRITAEVCVHHLAFDENDYHTKGNLIKWNPAIKTQKAKEALLQGLLNDKIDIVATDHAPHTLEEKQQSYFKAPSGGPLVQHSLPVMLEFCQQGILTPELVVRKMCHAPADLFRIQKRGYIRKGYYADLVIVDPDSNWTVADDNILYKCGWSPFTGTTFHSRITHTFVNGNLVYDNGKINDESKGIRLMFNVPIC